jgi:hypothetical protein
MKRRIVILAPTDGGDSLEKAIAKLTDLRCTIISEELVDETQTPATIRLADLQRAQRDKDRVSDSGLVYLEDLTLLTAYEAWQRLGGTIVNAGEGGSQEKRAMGLAFRTSCQMMARLGIKFIDLDPADFDLYRAGQWAQYDITGRAAGILEGVEICDLRLFMQVTDEDIATFHRCGPAFHDQLVSARERLRKTQQ